jgi:hypothetical protein
MKYLAYIVATLVGLMFSYMGVIFAMLGGPQSAYLVGALLLLAYAGVIFFLIRKDRAGKGLQFAYVLALPMILVTVMGQIFVLGKYGLSLLMPDSEPFIAECQATGVKFEKLPSSPVRSIAYDWDGKYHPPFNRFEVKYGTRITSLGRSDFPHPKSIEFVERKRSNLEGRPAQGPDGPYIRFPQSGAYYSIPALTADVLVHYRIAPDKELEKAETNQGVVQYEVTVIDRRTEERLASLRYMIDAKQRRGCGLTGANEMSERAFVLRAIGLGS